jgi:HlyD family secretion protein
MKNWLTFRKPVIPIVVVALMAGTGAWWWRARSDPKLSFVTAPVKRGDLAATISSTGTIEPVEVVDVGAQVAGRINSFGMDKDGKTIDYRSVVEEGAVLATIDDSVYAADLAVANAQLEQDKAAELSAGSNVEQAKAKLVQAEAEWNRAQELSRAKLMSGSDYDTAKANYEVAKANVSVAESAVAQAKASTVQARAAVERAQRNLDFCTIKSPVTGVIIDRRVNIGQTVVASLNAPSLFLIAKDLTKMQIWVAVNEADVGRILPGAPVTFTCDAFPGREFQGTVGKVRLNATMTQNVVMYTVEVNTENPDKLLLPYLTANVRFVLSSESDVLMVPNAALRWTPSSLAQIAPDARAGISADPPANDPPSTGQASTNLMKAPKSPHGTIWVKDREFVRPFEVNLGTSDGLNTAVTAAELREGEVAITGEIVATAQTDAKNPFLPVMRRR